MWSGPDWTIHVTDAEMTLTATAGSRIASAAEIAHLRVACRWFRWSLYNNGAVVARLRGMTKREADDLDRALDAARSGSRD